MSKESVLQYTRNGSTWVRCGSTVGELEPGFYDPTQTNQGWGLTPRQAVSDDLIDIPGTVADEIYADIDVFMATRSRYSAYGLTHKRGYLFFGPPGSGKTSLGLMLARRFIDTMRGVVVYANGVSEFYHAVDIMREVEPGRPSLYLLEEADDVVNNVHCLSILDGEQSLQGAVFIAMTNHKERLPPRIANRPGRFDRVVYVDCPPPAVQVEYLRRVAARNPGTTAEEAAKTAMTIVEALSGLPISMGHLREAFISTVLMGVDLRVIRKRFEDMASLDVEASSSVLSLLTERTEASVQEATDEYDPGEEKTEWVASNGFC
jgi:hypothetical protein